MIGRDQKISVLRQLLQRVQARASSMRPAPLSAPPPPPARVPESEPAPAFDLAPAPAPVPAFETTSTFVPTPAPPSAPPVLAPEAEFLEELTFSSPPPPPAAPAPLPPTSGTVPVAAPLGLRELDLADEPSAEPSPMAPSAFAVDDGEPLELIEVGPVEPEPTIDEEESAPVSSRRPRGPEPLDDVPTETDLAAELPFEQEVPLMTPPPESGRQQLVPLVEVSSVPLPELDAPTDDFELAIPVSAAPRAPAHSSHASGPSVEQLGGTIDLATDDSDIALELAAPKPTPSQLPSGEMEAVLPSAVGGGTYTPELAPPPEVADDLARHDLNVGLSAFPGRLEHTEPGPPVALRPPTAPPPAPVVVSPPAPAPTGVRLLPDPAPAAAPLPEVAAAPAPVAIDIAASVTRRQTMGATEVVAIVGEATRFVPETFGELLDASLALGADRE